MAVGQQGEFVAVVNDTDPKNGGKSYSLKISGNNHAQLLGKKIGDTVDGIFVGEGEQTDRQKATRICQGGRRQAILVTRSTGFKGHSLVFKNKGGEKKRFRYKPDGLRKRRFFRGNTISQDTRQINLKVIEAGKKSLGDILAKPEEASE